MSVRNVANESPNITVQARGPQKWKLSPPKYIFGFQDVNNILGETTFIFGALLLGQWYLDFHLPHF
jgi:hypothetical protein